MDGRGGNQMAFKPKSNVWRGVGLFLVCGLVLSMRSWPSQPRMRQLVISFATWVVWNESMLRFGGHA